MVARTSWRRRARADLPRPPADLGDWVLPHWLDRDLDPAATSAAVPSWTTIGNLDSAREATVDPRGLVTMAPGGWSLDWWVGADDRWRLPSREVAVRQRLVEDAPVVETAMRVPSGDVVHRAYAVRDGSVELVVVEIENRSPIPVALALAIRPFDAGAPACIRRVGLVDDRHVTVDGRVALVLPKPPSRADASTAVHGDVAARVLAGTAAATMDAVSCADGMATAAVIFPLAHRTMLRFALPFDAGRRGSVRAPTSLPASDRVANGWRAQGARGVRLVLPDERLQSAIDANRRFLLLQHDAAGRPVGTAAALAVTLDRQGFGREAGELLTASAAGQSGGGAFGDGWEDTGALLRAMAEHWRLGRDEDFAHEVAPAVAQGAEWIVRARRMPRPGADDRSGRRALVDAAELLRAAAEDEAADTASRFAAASVDDLDEHEWVTPDGLAAMLDAASPTWTWTGAGEGHDRLAVARFLEVTRARLVRDVTGGVALCSLVPDDWLGLGIEVHDAPTHAGRLSFAVRWHGDRPALLWELDPHAGIASVSLRVPGLDPSWSSTALRGDALLAPVAPPGTPVRLRPR